MFGEENSSVLEITHRIQKFNNNLYLLYPLLKDRNIPRKVKIIIYTSILRPILMYGHEAWALTSKMKSKIQAAEMRVLRLIKGVTRLDRLRNEDIRRELGIDSILDLVEKGQLRWFGHVKRMAGHRYPRRFLETMPDGTRPVGRPRMRWIDNIKHSIEKRGCSIQQVEQEMYADRAQWRRFLKHDD